MGSDAVIAIQTIIFGIVVVARLYMTSALARKRTYGFGWSLCAGLLYGSLMFYMELYILAAMEVVIMSLDSRGVIHNYRRNKKEESNERK